MNETATVTTIHPVQVGDTLEALARKYYNDASKVHLLAQANGISPTAILPYGSKVKIPPAPNTITGDTQILPSGYAAPIATLAPATVSAKKYSLLADWRLYAGIGAVGLLAWFLLRKKK